MSTPSSPASRRRLSLIALLTMAAGGIALCAVVLAPFVPGLVWALSLAIVAEPLRRWLADRMRPMLVAIVGVTIVTLLLLLPTAFLVWRIGDELGEGIQHVQQQLERGDWRKALENRPRLARLYDFVNRRIDLAREVGALSQGLQQTAGAWLRSMAWGVVQVGVALFTLFFLFRDQAIVLRTLRSFMPLSDRETDELFEQIRAMTHATIYGTLTVALVQGALGGSMFAILDIPGALLWGVVMAALAIVPTLGSFVVWLPTAAALAAQGSLGKAALLAMWGTLVVGTIDNVLYPILVGKEVRFHTLPVFFAIVGGLIVFGAAGIVLGPVVLASTVAIFGILKRRTAHARSAEQPA